MKRLLLMAGFFVSLCSIAFAQTPGEVLDNELAAGAAKDVSQDAAIDQLIIGDAALQDKDAALQDQIDALAERVTALEEGDGGTDPGPGPVEPPPVSVWPWPVYLLDLANNTQVELLVQEITVPAGEYTVQLSDYDEATGVSKPVKFFVNGFSCSPTGQEGQPPIHACGDNAKMPLLGGQRNEVKFIDATGTEYKLFINMEGGGSNPPPGEREAINSQIGPWVPAPWNVEEPCINIINCSGMSWSGGGMDKAALIAGGFIDGETGLPIKSPGGWLQQAIYFPSGNNKELIAAWDGKYILKWTCVNGRDDCADVWIQWAPTEYMNKVANNRVEFIRNSAGASNDHNAIIVRSINSPIASMAFVREENEAAYDAGQLFSPVFIDELKKYGVVRLLDLLSTGGHGIIKVEDVAPSNYLFWANTEWKSEDSGRALHQSMPLAAQFALGIESDNELWLNIPIMLGAGRPMTDFRPEGFDQNDTAHITAWAGAYRAYARANAEAIVASPEWDRYAAAFVEALIDSGYPADRKLYLTVSNEVWNFAGAYFMDTQYAWGLGEGLPNMGQGEAFRRAYGVLLARFKLALDAALQAAGRTQNIEYVFEGHAAYVERTEWAVGAAQAYLTSVGEEWEEHRTEFGLSVAYYWYGDWEKFLTPEQWTERLNGDWDQLAEEFADFILTGAGEGNLNWIISKVDSMIARNKPYGVKITGPYEAGPHIGKPSYIPREFYTQFVWGPAGARVNFEVNKVLAERYGGVFTNYALAGSKGGQPWFEGFYGDDNPYAMSWDELIEYFNLVEE